MEKLIGMGEAAQALGVVKPSVLADQSDPVSEHLFAVTKDGQFITNTLQPC